MVNPCQSFDNVDFYLFAGLAIVFGYIVHGKLRDDDVGDNSKNVRMQNCGNTVRVKSQVGDESCCFDDQFLLRLELEDVHQNVGKLLLTDIPVLEIWILAD